MAVCVRETVGPCKKYNHVNTHTHLTQFVKEWPQIDPHDLSLGCHQGNNFWCVVVKLVHKVLFQGNFIIILLKRFYSICDTRAYCYTVLLSVGRNTYL